MFVSIPMLLELKLQDFFSALDSFRMISLPIFLLQEQLPTQSGTELEDVMTFNLSVTLFQPKLAVWLSLRY